MANGSPTTSVCAAGVGVSRFRHRGRSSGFPAEDRRYHLYAALSCPWAHRALIMRAVKGLEDCIPVSIVAPWTHGEGWSFADYPGATGDRANGRAYLHELYCRADPRYTGRVTVPVLWDTHTSTCPGDHAASLPSRI